MLKIIMGTSSMEKKPKKQTNQKIENRNAKNKIKWKNNKR